MPNKLLTINAAAKLLGVTQNTIRNWEASGKIDSIRTYGGHRRFVEADILAAKNVKYKHSKTQASQGVQGETLKGAERAPEGGSHPNGISAFDYNSSFHSVVGEQQAQNFIKASPLTQRQTPSLRGNFIQGLALKGADRRAPLGKARP